MNDNDLDLDLEQLARRFDVPAGDIDGVVQRGRDRRRRHHRVLGAATVLAVIAGTTVVVRLADGDDPSTPVAANDGGQTSAQLGDAQIHWEKKDASAPLGMSWTWVPPVSSGDTLYAVSSAPGEAPANKIAPRAIWRSDDGIDWTLSSTTTDIYASDLAATPDQLYAVGTGPASAAVAGNKPVPEALVGRSDDRGAHWSTSRLPIDLPAIADKSVSVSVHPDDVAAGSQGTVAVVEVHAELDMTKVLPDVQTPNGWALSSTGIDILGAGNPCTPQEESAEKEPTPNGRVYVVSCFDKSADANTADPRTADTAVVEGKQASHNFSPQEARGVVAHYDWSQLGIGGALLDAVLDQPFVFRADAGRDTFERVAVPLEAGLFARTVYVQSSDDGFDLIASSTPATVDAMQRGASTLSVLHSGDGREWSVASAPLGDISWIAASGRLDGHLAVLGGTNDGAPKLARLVDGSWTVTTLDGVVDEKGFIGIAAIGPLGVVLTTFDRPETKDSSAADLKDSGPPAQHLLASRDGVTWSTYDLDELAGGSNVQVLRMTVVGDRAVVAVSYPKQPGERYARQAAIVGTPE